MKNIQSDYMEEFENLDEDEKLDLAFHEMEMIYKSRCVDVPLASNVTVVEVAKKDKDSSQENN